MFVQNSWNWHNLNIFCVLFPSVSQAKMLEIYSESMFSTLYNIIHVSKILNKIVFEDVNVQRFIKQPGLHFDVILVEDFFNDSLFMFAHKFKAPVISICRCHYTPLFSHLFRISFSHNNFSLFPAKTTKKCPPIGVYGATEFIDMQHGLFPPPSVVPHYVSIKNWFAFFAWMLHLMQFFARIHTTATAIYGQHDFHWAMVQHTVRCLWLDCSTVRFDAMGRGACPKAFRPFGSVAVTRWCHTQHFVNICQCTPSDCTTATINARYMLTYRF